MWDNPQNNIDQEEDYFKIWQPHLSPQPQPQYMLT